MIKAVLLDLDNTLLTNPDHQFVIQFMERLNQHFHQATGLENIWQYFREGIRALSSPKDMVLTNTQLMLQIVSQKSGLPAQKVETLFDGFYDTHYDNLQQYTSPVPKSQDLIRLLLKQNIMIAIATNPIYPKTAIFKRIEWAGLVDFIDRFALITHADNMYCAKPNPAYYRQVIDYIDIEPTEAIMVGDSIRNDIEPAGQLGIHSVHITETYSLAQFYDYICRPDWRYS